MEKPYFAYRLGDDTELRLLEPRYRDEVFAAVDANRAHIRRWLGWVDAVAQPHDIKLTSTNLIDLGNDGNFAAGIWRQGQLVGVIGIHNIDWRQRCSVIGYWLAGSCQGQGIMTRACRAVIGYIFHALELHRVEIHAASGNLRSQNVARRLGFRHESTQRQVELSAEGPRDQMVFALTRDEWQDDGERLAFTYLLNADTELHMLMPHDAEEIFAVADRNRAYLRPWMSWMDGTTEVRHSREYIRHALLSQAEEREVHWGIWYRGHFAGGIGTLPINHTNKRVEIGYWIAEEFQGKGLVTMAGQAMLAYLFGTLAMNRVEIRFRADNTRSRAVAERLGFTREGIQRQAYWHDGEASDIVQTSLLRSEWEARHVCNDS